MKVKDVGATVLVSIKDFDCNTIVYGCLKTLAMYGSRREQKGVRIKVCKNDNHVTTL